MSDTSLSRKVEALAKDVLENTGATVTAIPRSEQQTPDFVAKLSGTTYLIEVKAREINETRIGGFRTSLDKGHIHYDGEELRRRNVISSIIESGSDQLEAYSPETDFRVLWLHGVEPFGERYRHQFFNALYGATYLGDDNDPEWRVTAIYFRDSDFFRYRSVLDGAIVTTKPAGGDNVPLQLLINDHSPRYNAFRVSSVAHAFRAGLYDPISQEQQGNALVVRGSLDRRDENAVMRHLNVTTGRRVFQFDLGHASISIAIPRRPLIGK